MEMQESKKNTRNWEEKVKELKQKLQDAEEKNSFTNAILEGGSVIIWAVDNHLELISFNQNYFNFFLQKEDESKVGYETRGRIKYTNSTAFWKKKYQQSLDGKSHNFDIKIEQKGVKAWKEVFLTPIYNTKGTITGVSGLAHDITDKMKSKIDLIKSEEKFRNIFESFQDLYFRCDMAGTLNLLSPSVRDIIGYPEWELLGKNVKNYYNESLSTKGLLRTLIKGKRIRNFEVGLLHKSGKVIYSICNIRVIYDNATPKYVEGVVRDITELKETTQELQHSKEVAEKSLRVKERFLANMSHEIRTPLNGIMGMLHLLDETSLNRKQQDHVTALKSSSEILLNILNDLLDISKIEAGKMQIKNVTTSTKGLFNKLSLLYRPQATDKQINLDFKLDEAVPEYISTDETKLLQVYSNLISNAIKFTPAGGSVWIELQLKKEKKNSQILLKGCIQDTGIGIRESDQKKLFTSFTQLDSSSSKNYEGTGLGLHISKKIVKLMKGKMGISSSLGNGSTFWFTWQTSPVTSAEDIDINNTDPVKLNNSPRILVVDDNKVNRDLASQMLINAGCQVTTASSGKHAITNCKKHSFDMILMDIQMPDMDGIEAAKKIKKLCVDCPPIIAMTAYSMHGDREKIMNSGLDDFIAKPIHPVTLLKIVETWTGQMNHTLHFETQWKKSAALHGINPVTIHNLCRLTGPEVLKVALMEFDVECKRQLQTCRKLFKEKKIEHVLNILHTLKGNSGTLGIERIAQQAELIENSLKNKKYHNFEDDMLRLEMSHEEFINEVEQIEGLILNSI